MKSVVWLLLVGKYQNQMKILVELPGGFKKEYFKNKHTALCMLSTVNMYTICSILYDLKIALCQSQIRYYKVKYDITSCYIG